MVGTYYLGPGPNAGYLYSSGIYTSIAFPGVSYTWAFGINDSGEVVGTYDGYIGKGNLQDSGAFLYFNGEFRLIKAPKSLMTRAYGINNAGAIVGSYSPTTKTRPRRHKTRLPD